MPKTVTVTLYQYSELNDEAKEVARDWWREGTTSDVYDQSCEYVKDDAAAIGLAIVQLTEREPSEGRFTKSPPEVIKAIMENHGAECETYRTAERFKKLFIAAEDEACGLEDTFIERTEELAKDFLEMLLEDYRVMRDREDEYQLSDEMVAENIEANEYDFTEDGKRYTGKV